MRSILAARREWVFGKEKMKKSGNMYLRIPLEIKAWIDQEAVEQERPRNSVVVRELRAAMRAQREQAAATR